MPRRPVKKIDGKVENPILAEELSKLKGMRYYEQRIKLQELVSIGAVGEVDIDTPDWLIEGSSIESPVWVCRFGTDKKGIKIEVDFRIELYDGSVLTESVNATLLKFIKVFLVLQIHPRYNGGSRKGSDVEAQIFRHGLHFIDWLLMGGYRFNIAECGLSLITESDLVEYLLLNTRSPVSTHLYAYPTRLAIELKRLSSEITVKHALETKIEWPECLELIDINDWTLEMTKDDLLRARIWIYRNGCYTKQLGVVKYNSAPFIRSFYRNTLGGMNLVVKSFEELNGGVVWRTEYPSVPIRNKVTPTVSSKILGRNLRALKKLTILNSYVPSARFDNQALAKITIKTILSKIDEKPNGRFRSLPGEVVFNLVRASYEYISDCAGEITRSVISHSLSSRFNGSKRAFNLAGAPNEELSRKIGLRDLNRFSVWMIPYSKRPSNFFELLRSNHCLYDSYTVLMGAYLSIIGLLTARRQDELLGLKALTCLAPNKNPYRSENKNIQYELVFYGGKTGNRNGKEVMQVTVPTMVAKLIWDLKTFHSSCVMQSLIPIDAPLFIYIRPDNLAFRPMDASIFNNCLSAVCDYTQTPVVTLENGKKARFYIRQHQMRRFFAMAFFASAGFKGLDALRAFLGHSDLEHLYNYIVEITPGSMLEGVKTECITDAILKGDSTIEHLNEVKKMLCDSLGCRDIGAKSYLEIGQGLKQAAERGDIAADFDFNDFTEDEIYADVAKLIKSHRIDLNPDFATVTTEDGSVFGMKLFVKVRYA